MENNAPHGIPAQNFLLEKNVQPTLIIITVVSWVPATPPVWFVNARNLLTENPLRNALFGTRIPRIIPVQMVAPTLSVTARDTCHPINVFAGIRSTFGRQRTVLHGIQGPS